MNIYKLLLIALFFGLIPVIFPFLFLSVPISGGDYTPALSVVQILNGNFSAWCDYSNFGNSCLATILHYDPIWFVIHIISNMFHLSSVFIERLFWWFPFIFVSFFSVTLLTKKIFPQMRFWPLAPIVYVYNTYALLLLAGGQISGIGIAFSFIPLSLLTWIKLLERPTLLFSIYCGLLLAFIIALDPRIAYIAYVINILYFVYFFVYKKQQKSFIFKENVLMIVLIFILPVLIATLLHFYWILPALIYRDNPLKQLGSAYNSIAAAEYLSFAKFENVLGLLHPNWPENIFGLTHFMRPEFLLIPVFAFSSLFFLKNNKKYCYFVCFFVLLAVISIFLAKGTNDPFGEIYRLMFLHFPSFSLFRDSTKWYMPVVLSYSLLIPYTIEQTYAFLINKWKYGLYIARIFLLCCLLYLLLLIKPALTHNIGGTFASKPTPNEYITLEKFLNQNKAFFRVLWVPTLSSFDQFNLYHPSINGYDFYNPNLPDILNDLKKTDNSKQLQDASVKYVILPDDVNKTIFLKDRKYDDSLYLETLHTLSSVTYLYKVASFGKIIVWETSTYHDHFWLKNINKDVSYTIKSPTDYLVTLHNVRKGYQLIFSDSFNTDWVGFVYGDQKDYFIHTIYNNRYNSFILPKNGSYTVEIMFSPQKYVGYGGFISVVTAISIIVYLLYVGGTKFVKLQRNR